MCNQTEMVEATVCTECGEICDVYSFDQGGYEEVWGRKEWVSHWESLSACCRAEYKVALVPEE